jgi:hypothetical protein
MPRLWSRTPRGLGVDAIVISVDEAFERTSSAIAPPNSQCGQFDAIGGFAGAGGDAEGVKKPARCLVQRLLVYVATGQGQREDGV